MSRSALIKIENIISLDPAYKLRDRRIITKGKGAISSHKKS